MPSPPNKRPAEREGAGQTEDGGDPRDQSSRIGCSWQGPTQHRSLQGPPRAEPACTGLLSRGGELLFWVLAESPPLCEVLLVPSASVSLSQTARRAGPALVLRGAHSGSGPPRHAGRTGQPPHCWGRHPPDQSQRPGGGPASMAIPHTSTRQLTRQPTLGFRLCQSSFQNLDSILANK